MSEAVHTLNYPGFRLAQAVCRPVDDVPAARELVLQDPADLREGEQRSARDLSISIFVRVRIGVWE